MTQLPVDQCETAIQQHLLAAYRCQHPKDARPPFAFRLHQFISKGDTVFASLEERSQRYITLLGQKYVPRKRDTHILLPLTFCRECGQEYYVVRIYTDSQTENKVFFPRDFSEHEDTEDGEAGFLYINPENPWPSSERDIFDRLPEDWLEERQGRLRIRRDYQAKCPKPVIVRTDGTSGEQGIHGHTVPAPFRFCLSCSVVYGS